jgi:hypothetical protein
MYNQVRDSIVVALGIKDANGATKQTDARIHSLRFSHMQVITYHVMELKTSPLNHHRFVNDCQIKKVY